MPSVLFSMNGILGLCTFSFCHSYLYGTYKLILLQANLNMSENDMPFHLLLNVEITWQKRIYH